MPVRPPTPWTASALAAVVLSATFALACDRPPAVEIREWTPADHDHSDDKGGAAKAPRKPAAKPEDENRALAELAWRQQCSTCHGAVGRGDGPQGPMVKASDLTDPAWQAKTNDAQIALAITNGKGRMPKFELSDVLVKALTAHVRSLGAPAAPSPSATP
ncbi:MAG: c-type cytochrome [Polyangiaceae bacterium]